MYSAVTSGVDKLIDSRCRATIGIVSNLRHGKHKLHKAGQSRWLGRRPIVRGVAMNPVDHPHGGGEGRTKGEMRSAEELFILRMALPSFARALTSLFVQSLLLLEKNTIFLIKSNKD
ncbi:unnamed protein product [Sphagnum tenellum]